MTFRGGIHPLHRLGEGKTLSANAPIRVMDVPKIVRIPLRQDISVPAVPYVAPGDRVLMGQCLGKADGFLSVPIHSSVSGTVTAIEQIPSVTGKNESAIVIENDFLDETAYSEPLDYQSMDPQDIIQTIKMAGIVGMGGAGFPTHVKLSVPPQKGVDLLIINGAECEPFLTADQRLMTEQADRVIMGTQIMMRALNVKRALVGIEDNKPEAIAAMQKAASNARHIRVNALETKYPQGYEKTLIYALTGRVVPAGGLPMDAKVVVANTASAAAVADIFTLGKPSFERVVTVTGAVKNPSNLLIRVGTTMEDAIEAAGGIDGIPLKIISGGPMMGRIVPTTKCIVTKNTSGILVLDKKYTRKEKETPCIRCGKCVIGCPMNLSPVLIMDATEAADYEAAEALHAMDCMSCGSCSYICPANRPLAQSIAFGKSKIQAKRALARREKEEAEKKAAAETEEKKAAEALKNAVAEDTKPEQVAQDLQTIAQTEEKQEAAKREEVEDKAIAADALDESADEAEVEEIVRQEEEDTKVAREIREAALIREQATAIRVSSAEAPLETPEPAAPHDEKADEVTETLEVSEEVVRVTVPRDKEPEVMAQERAAAIREAALKTRKEPKAEATEAHQETTPHTPKAQSALEANREPQTAGDVKKPQVKPEGDAQSGKPVMQGEKEQLPAAPASAETNEEANKKKPDDTQSAQRDGKGEHAQDQKDKSAVGKSDAQGSAHQGVKAQSAPGNGGQNAPKSGGKRRRKHKKKNQAASGQSSAPTVNTGSPSGSKHAAGSKNAAAKEKSHD